MQLQDVMFIVLAAVAGSIAGALVAYQLVMRGTAERVDAETTKARSQDQATIAGLTARVSELQSVAEFQRQTIETEQVRRAETAARLDAELDTVRGLRAELDSRSNRLALVGEELASARTGLEQSRISADVQEEARRELVERLATEARLVETLRAEVRAKDVELEARSGRLAALGEELAAVRTALEQTRTNAESQEQSKRDLTDRLAAETQLVELLRADVEARGTRLSAVTAELAQRVVYAENVDAQLAGVRAELAQLRSAREALAEANAQLSTRVATSERERALEQAAAEEKLRLLNDARERLAGEFKLVAGAIMEENAKRFAEQSQTQIGTVIDPLRERLTDLQKKVEEVYVADVKDRTALREQVQQLVSLNQTLSAEAHNLTNALRGSNKAQGNWGELILERILEDAGLRAGVEFVLQDSRESEEGRRQQPDVVVQLPEGRKIIIDAKVSLMAFERATSAVSDDERMAAVREHVLSVRNHVKGLSERRYEKLYDATLDFVVMFVPIEPAFMMAVNEDERLCVEAWDKNVLLVSPSTLLFVLRTVAYLWRQEAQSRNAKDIADRGAVLYDKLVSFVKDLDDVGGRISAAQHSYGDAIKKLSTGRGSVIRQAEMLVELGVKPNKRLPLQLANDALASDEDGVSAHAAEALLPYSDPNKSSIALRSASSSDSAP